MKDMNEQKNEQNGKLKRIAKKGLGISLCAVLAGGIAAGAYEGVNTLRGFENVSAAPQEEVTLLKAESKKASEEEAVKGSLDVSDIVEKAMPSVVSITTKSLQEVQDYFGFFQYGYGQDYAPQQEVEGSGSGIIVGKSDDKLLIVTNYHVVEDANNVSVTFADGNSYTAEARGYDSDRDLAVVAVPLDDLESDTLDAISVASIGSSDDLKVGEQVLAIGNAMGYGQSVTTGIVSAKNRRLNDEGTPDDEDGVNLIQTDAAINPGNSGGALLNMKGEVVGINSAKLASTTVEGMGYAIAISDVSDILEDLMNEVPREKVENGSHGVLGIVGSTVSQEGIQIYGMPAGVFVKEVTEGMAAEAAGMKKNSIITKFDGKSVHSIEELVERLEYYEPGEEVEVTVEIGSGEGYEEETLTVTLDASEEDSDEDDQNSKDKDDNEEKEDFDDGEEDSDEESSGSIFEDWERENGSIPDISEFFRR